MFFSKFFGRNLGEPRYIRRTRVYLQEARMAMLEHSVAAEYYQSSASMYAERAARLEQELQAWEDGLQQVPRMGRYGRHVQPAKPPVDAASGVPSPNTPSVGMVRAA